jgi:RNA polymerase sigma factor (sigma-70 family)
MDGESGTAVLRDIHRLFRSGTAAGVSDGQLLRRFVERRDEAAFEALLERHGPMVLTVCRQSLRDPNDAADAFQATLLVLVRKAGTLDVSDSLGPWLYGVAFKVAARARTVAIRRRERERTGTEPEAPDASVPKADDLDLAPVLHEELNRLPERFRAAIVHCHLEGLSHEQAALRLRCPVGTVRSRLARGRALLRDRLGRRGLDGSALAAAPWPWPVMKPARVPLSLLESTLKAAATVAAGPGAGASWAVSVSVPVARLTEGVLMSLFTMKLKAAAAVVLASGLLAAGAVFAYQPPSGRADNVAPNSNHQPAAHDRLGITKDTKTLAIEGKLDDVVSLNLDKQPFGKAINFLQNYTGLNIVLDPKALSDQNVTSASPITLKADNISVETALKLMLRPLRLTYRIEDEVLLITSPQRPQTNPKVYYIGDLIMPPPKPQAAPGIDRDRSNIDMTPVIELITSSIAPGTWKVIDSSGNTLGVEVKNVNRPEAVGTITPFFLSISLIVRHTPEVHDQVANLLRRLRRIAEAQQPASRGEEQVPLPQSPVDLPANPAAPAPAPALGLTRAPQAGSRADRIRRLMAELNREVEALTREQGRTDTKLLGP